MGQIQCKSSSDRWGKYNAKAAVTDGANAMQKQHSDGWSKCNKYINGSPVSEGGEMYTDFFFTNSNPASSFVTVLLLAPCWVFC